jgi:hypothetical protein
MKITDFFVFIANIATVLAAFPPEGIVSTNRPNWLPPLVLSPQKLT